MSPEDRLELLLVAYYGELQKEERTSTFFKGALIMLDSCQPGILLRKIDAAFCKDSSALKTDVRADLVSGTSYFKRIAHPVDVLKYLLTFTTVRKLWQSCSYSLHFLFCSKVLGAYMSDSWQLVS